MKGTDGIGNCSNTGVPVAARKLSPKGVAMSAE